MNSIGNIDSFMFVLPELIIAATMVIIFLLEALIAPQGKKRQIIFPLLAGLGLVAALVLLFATGGFAFISNRPIIFNGLITLDPFSVFSRGLVIIATTLVIFLGIDQPSLPDSRRIEYHGLLLLLTLGMCLLASANHLLMIFVALETVSLASYLLTGFDNRSGRSAEAGLKYVLYGGVASGVMLFGFTLLFGLFGELSLSTLGRAIVGSQALQNSAGQWAALIAFVFVLTGIGFKIAAAPFHMWCPDVYEGAPTPFTALLSVAPKAAGFAVLMRITFLIFPNTANAGRVLLNHAVPWVLVLGIVASITMTLGNLSAIWQNNLKRLLAYSSIAHAGYLLMGVVAGGSDGIGALIVYLAVYLAMNIGAFAVVAAVDRAYQKAQDAKSDNVQLHSSEDISAFCGLGRRAPLLALCMAIFLISLAGLPPTAGFIGKLYLFAALIKNGGFWYVALALVGIINSVISLYFYARVLKAMYLERNENEQPNITSKSTAAFLAFGLAAATLVFGIFWQPLADMASWSAKIF
ncbi:MAG: NADH-quinone oxidoreductase subunit N [Deltaproteobacteria bacterium]|nr:NADH-quinone oxidoreductase subunit N [Deltaproteobacteria bacterium]